jgi:hypothetical protein
VHRSLAHLNNSESLGKGFTLLPKTKRRTASSAKFESFTNARIAELLASEGYAAKPPLPKAFRRASRRAFSGPRKRAN